MKLAGCSPPQLTHFGGGELADFGQSFDACCWSHFTHLGGRPQKVEECLKDWQLKHWRMGREFLYFSHLTIQWHNLWSCSTLRISVPGWKVTTNIGYLVITVFVVLSIFVIWVMRTVCMSWVASSSRMSSSGTFGGMPFSTNRGWVVCGNGYVCY